MIRRSWTQAASIEETLALWAASLREIKKRIRAFFGQERVAANAGFFLEGLLGDEQRKTGWMRAEAAGDPGPWRQQAVLGRSDWGADVLRDIVRDYVIEHLADDDAVLVIDETGFLKQGKASCGVARQYTGSTGMITSCQIGVFAAYVSRHGHAFIDRALYLPKEWTDDPDRLEAAYLPLDAGFATKPKLATRMIARAIAASVPFKWVAGDTVYGVGDIEQQLRQAGKGYVLGVGSTHVFQSWGKRRSVAGKAADIARTRRSSDWKHLSAGAGTKGPRLHDWCYLELADLEVEEFNSANQGLWTRGLTIRRHIADGDLGVNSDRKVGRDDREKQRRGGVQRVVRRPRPAVLVSTLNEVRSDSRSAKLGDRSPPADGTPKDHRHPGSHCGNIPRIMHDNDLSYRRA
jgi:SRSO17 transposase